MSEHISARQFRESEGVEDWRVLGEGACAHFRTASGAKLVAAIADLDGVALDLRHDGVTVRLITIEDGYYGLSASAVDLARRISAAARELGIPADPSAVQTVQVTIDALDIANVLPFWRAVLAYVDRGDGPEDIVDPRGRGPAIWFQQMDAPRPQRNRVHFDVWVPHHLAEERIAAALAAGGRLVSDKEAPGFWVLADPESNEVCVATPLTRD
ncbi:VOC family protein [Nonomuraea sp. NPDC050556]|uniref:VOC family protein n=1 Tax=Nonomuraea sp. NPDC050556 TaxID=3364369 RepID=UPI0037BCD9C8